MTDHLQTEYFMIYDIHPPPVISTGTTSCNPHQLKIVKCKKSLVTILTPEQLTHYDYFNNCGSYLDNNHNTYITCNSFPRDDCYPVFLTYEDAQKILLKMRNSDETHESNECTEKIMDYFKIIENGEIIQTSGNVIFLHPDHHPDFDNHNTWYITKPNEYYNYISKAFVSRQHAGLYLQRGN